VRAAVRPCRVAEGLAEPAPFRMRLEVMLPDHQLYGQQQGIQGDWVTGG
jgi:hypothetical protein